MKRRKTKENILDKKIISYLRYQRFKKTKRKKELFFFFSFAKAHSWRFDTQPKSD